MYKNGIAVDFDGTLFTDQFPGIGEPIPEVIEFCKLQKWAGYPVILWTCRTGPRLQEAIEACRKQGLEFDAINDNPFSEYRELGATRKIYADLYIDDKNMRPRDIQEGESLEDILLNGCPSEIGLPDESQKSPEGDYCEQACVDCWRAALTEAFR